MVIDLIQKREHEKKSLLSILSLSFAKGEYHFSSQADLQQFV